MKIIIIEDEKLTANDLAKTIKAIEPDIEIVKFLYSVEEAIEYLKTTKEIDLIFSDIELGDGLSFEIFEKLNLKTPIIFCTAYDKYSLKAFNTVGIDYILKPFSKIAVEKALLKYQQLKDSFKQPTENYATLIETLKNQLITKNPSVLVTQGDKIIPIQSNHIALFFVEGEYCFAYTFEQKTYIVSQNLEILEKTFAPTFFRANRQFLINQKAVKDATHSFNRKLEIHLTIPFKEQIIVSKLKVAAFLEWLAM